MTKCVNLAMRGCLVVFGLAASLWLGSCGTQAEPVFAEKNEALPAPAVFTALHFEPAPDIPHIKEIPEGILQERDAIERARAVIDAWVRFPTRVPIFMYHTSSEEYPGGLSELFVRPSVFEQQIIHLVENGYTFVTFDDWDSLHNVERPVFITFDDGYEANYTEIFPILQRHNARITIFLTLSNVRRGGLTEEMIQRMSDSGLVKFESHTLTHRNLTTISHDEASLRRELGESRTRIEELTGKEVVAIAYPYGRFNARVAEVAGEYYRFGLSTAFGWHYTRVHCYFEMRRLRVNRSTSLNRFIEMLDM